MVARTLLGLLFVLSAVSANANSSNDAPYYESIFAKPLPNYLVVNQNISRSGRPSEEGLQMLKKLKVKTIIDLEDDASVVHDESQAAKKMGFQFFSSPMSWDQRPTDSQIKKLLEELQDSSLQPILIHCHHGRDRTGLVVGLYRVFVEKWKPEKAYEEMLANGFHPAYKALDGYYKDKTGY